MANIIANRLEFVGSISDVEKIFDKYSTTIPARIMKIHDVLIYEKDDENGYYNEQTKVFEIPSKVVLNEIPDGFVPRMLEEVFIPFDFDKIVPIPVELQNDKEYFDSTTVDINKVWDWKLENWGVSSEHYYFEKISSTTIQFCTDWNPVPKIVEVISRDFPDVLIIYEAVDENSDDLFAKSIYKNGEEIAEVQYESETQQAIELRLKLFPYQIKYFNLVQGKFIPKSYEEIFGETNMELEKRAS